MFTDIHDRRISNRLICLGIITGLVFQFYEHGTKGLLIGTFHLFIPIILLFLLFLMHALGAGDIKLFSMIGSIWSFELLLWCVVFSFVIGAILSLGKMICTKNLRSRLIYFQGYVQKTFQEGQISVYDRPSHEKRNFIHFSISILAGYLFAIAKVYL